MNRSYNMQLNLSQADLTQMSFIDRAEEEMPKPITRKFIFLYILSFILFATLGVYFFIFFVLKEIEKNSADKTNLFIYKVVFYLIISICIWIITTLVVFYIESAHIEDGSFIELILKKMRTRITIVTTLFVLSIAMINFDKVFEIEENNIAPPLLNSKWSYIWLQKQIIENFTKILQSIASWMFFMTLRKILLEGAGYVMNLSNYHKRLSQNNKDLEKIFLINSVTGKKIIYKSESWIKGVFRKLSPDGKPLTSETLNYFLSKEDSAGVMELFDLYKNNSVPENQFKSVWLEVIRTKEEIKSLFAHKDNIRGKLSNITFCIFFLFAMFSIFFIYESGQNFTQFLTVFLSCVLPLSFIFGSVLGDLFRSIIFVFLVRPFETGDMIEFNCKKYQVEDIGLMYSTFKYNSLSVTVQNTKIMDSHIINYRLSKFIEKVYTFTYNIDVYKSKANELRERIRSVLKRKQYSFDKNLVIRDVNLVGNDNIEFNVIIYANLHSVNYEEEIDNFTLELNSIINNLGSPQNIKDVSIQTEKAVQEI